MPLVGLGWGLWHLRLNVTQWGHYGDFAIPLLMLTAPVGLTAAAVLMTWIHNHGRSSMLLMILCHLSLTSSSFLFGPPADSTGPAFLRYYLVGAAVLWTAAAAVVVFGGLQPNRPSGQG